MYISRQRIISISEGLTRLSKMTNDVEVSYAIAKNMREIRSEIEAISAASQPVPGIIEYENKRISLAKKFSKKDDAGQPVVSGIEFVIEDRSIFDEELAELREEYKEALEKNETKNEELKLFLNGSVDINFHMIQFAQLKKCTLEVQEGDPGLGVLLASIIELIISPCS